VSPANPGYSAKEFAFQLKDSGAKAIVTQAHLLKIAVAAAELAEIPKDRILLIGDERHDSMPYFLDFIKLSRDVTRTAREEQGPSDLAFIPYSSGTTG
jgi:4-coumarate--CoA ligase